MVGAGIASDVAVVIVPIDDTGGADVVGTAGATVVGTGVVTGAIAVVATGTCGVVSILGGTGIV